MDQPRTRTPGRRDADRRRRPPDPPPAQPDRRRRSAAAVRLAAQQRRLPAHPRPPSLVLVYRKLGLDGLCDRRQGGRRPGLRHLHPRAGPLPRRQVVRRPRRRRSASASARPCPAAASSAARRRTRSPCSRWAATSRWSARGPRPTRTRTTRARSRTSGRPADADHLGRRHHERALRLRLLRRRLPDHGVERPPAVVWPIDPGSPAWKAGVRTGWAIIEIGTVKTTPTSTTCKSQVALSGQGRPIPFDFPGPTARARSSHRPRAAQATTTTRCPVIGVAPPRRLKLLPARASRRATSCRSPTHSAAAAARVARPAPGDVVAAGHRPGQGRRSHRPAADQDADRARRAVPCACRTLGGKPLTLDVRRGGDGQGGGDGRGPADGFDFGDPSSAPPTRRRRPSPSTSRRCRPTRDARPAGGTAATRSSTAGA